MRPSLRAREVSSQWKLHPVETSCPLTMNPGVLPLPSHSISVMALLGLQHSRPFHRDPAFLLLVTLGPIVWFSITGLLGFQLLAWQAIWSAAFLSVTLWQPLFEELLFRGIIQGYALQSMGVQKPWYGLTYANFFTSLLFAVAHLATHSIWWSFLIFIPSLCFGFVRDRFGSVYPAIALHVFYNAGYFLLSGADTFHNAR